VELDGRVAVITGGTRGIGFGIAEGLAAAGAKVVIGSRSEKKGEEALERLDVGDRAMFQRVDVLAQSEVEAFVDAAKDTYGRVDILVNNAGGSDGYALTHQLTDEAWNKAADWLLNSAFWATRRALNHMVEQGEGGRIINISSVEGKEASKAAVSHYITFKHAMNGLTKAVAFEYGPQGITSNAICPGAIETDLMKDNGPAAAESMGITYEQFLENYAEESMIKRLNTTEEVAAMAVLLASDVGAGITGALLNVDGGTAAW
jgi:3-hydroxybutyrate dehydrogenase